MPLQTAVRTKIAPDAPAVKMGRQMRTFSLRAEASTPLDAETRLLTMSFSSEQPVERWFGNEVLSHADTAADFSRLNDGANLLFNHNWDDVIGVVEKAWIKDARGYCTVRFAKNARGDEVMALVEDGILRNVSFAYQVESYVEEGEGSPDDPDDPTYTATRWMAYEISLVTVPADQTVGIGRADAGTEIDVPIERRAAAPQTPAPADSTKGNTMPQETGAAGAADVAVIEENVRKATLTAERERVTAVTALCERFKMTADFTRNLVNGGATIEVAQREVLNALPAQAPVAGPGSELGLTEKEKAGFSLVRAINAIVNSNWQAAGFEREVSLAMAKRAGRDMRNNSFFMPTDLPFAVKGSQQARAIYQVGTAAQGGNLVATNLLAGSFIEVLRNSSVTGKLGAQFLTGLVGKIAIPRQNAATGTYWVAESGAVTEGEATFDQVTLQPRTIGSLSKMSRLALLQTTPDVEMLARNDLLAVMALGVDLAAISGSGASNQPTGVVNQSGVGSVVGGTNGANVTFDHIIQLYSQPKIANAPMQSLGFAINGKTYGYLSTQKSTTGQYLWNPGGGIAQGPADMLRGYPYTVSQQLRSSLTKGTAAGICSELVFGNWNELLIGEWGVMEVMVNPFDSTGFANGDVIIRALQTVDVGVRHGASFAVMSDALTPGF